MEPPSESVRSNRKENNNSDDKKSGNRESKTTAALNNSGQQQKNFLDISTTAAASFGGENAFKFTQAPEDPQQKPIAGETTKEKSGVQRLLTSARQIQEPSSKQREQVCKNDDVQKEVVSSL